ncbi:MAG: TetR/AcrR family transcriptional regulator [Stackebrandtia sp.]
MDPRVARTRSSLQHALMELAREHQLDDITVADITNRAEVNRSSFYLHYNDKETLLADALESAVDEMSKRLETSTIHSGEVHPELHYYLTHIAENVALYRRVLGDHGSAVVAARLRTRIELIVRDSIDTTEKSAFAGLPLDVVAAGIAGSALGVITAWLAREPLPPIEEAATWVWRVLIGPGHHWHPGTTSPPPAD